MSDKKIATPIESHLLDMQSGVYNGNILYFDSTDGELKVQGKKEKLNPDCLVLEQLSEDGFM